LSYQCNPCDNFGQYQNEIADSGSRLLGKRLARNKDIPEEYLRRLWCSSDRLPFFKPFRFVTVKEKRNRFF
jgi:hypothetical protein